MWDINYLAVAACGVASLVLGFIWYSALFGKAWQKEWGLTDEAIKDANMGMIFGGFLVLNLLAAFILGHVLATYGGPGVQTSLMIGFGVGLGFVATAIGGNYLFARKSLKLFLIDGSYWVLLYTIEGAIFGLLR